VKRYLYPWIWDRFAMSLYNDKAGKQFKISNYMIETGINVPKPLAVVRDLSGRPPSVLYM